MNETALVKAEKTTYPFRFFCEERYSHQEVLALVAEMYEEVDKYHNLTMPPAAGYMTYALISFFLQESFARIILRGDFNGEAFGAVFAEQVKEMFADSDMDVNEFVNYCTEHFQFMSTDLKYQENFQRDFRYAMTELGLVFADTEHSLESYVHFFRNGTFRDMVPIGKIMVNSAIVEVW